MAARRPQREVCENGRSTPVKPPVWDLTDACLSDCTLARCGDGVVRRDLAEDQPGYEFWTTPTAHRPTPA